MLDRIRLCAGAAAALDVLPMGRLGENGQFPPDHFSRPFSPDPLMAQIWYSSGPLPGRPKAQDALYSNVSETSAGSEGTQFWSNSGSADHFSQMTQTIFPPKMDHFPPKMVNFPA